MVTIMQSTSGNPISSVIASIKATLNPSNPSNTIGFNQPSAPVNTGVVFKPGGPVSQAPSNPFGTGGTGGGGGGGGLPAGQFNTGGNVVLTPGGFVSQGPTMTTAASGATGATGGGGAGFDLGPSLASIGASGGTYNPLTGVYTSSTGSSSSMASAPKGALITFGGGDLPSGTYGGSRIGGGYSYVDKTTGLGFEVSPKGVKTAVPYGGVGWAPDIPTPMTADQAAYYGKIDTGEIAPKGTTPSRFTPAYTTYASPLSSFYDPVTGKLIEQSMTSTAAASKGYLPVSVTGETITGGKVVSSDTGLLTPAQAARFDFLQKLNKKSEELPTNFILGGTENAPKPMTIADLTGPKSSYDIALKTAAYLPGELKQPLPGEIGYVSKQQQYVEAQVARKANLEGRYGVVGDVIAMAADTGQNLGLFGKNILRLGSGNRLYGLTPIESSAVSKEIDKQQSEINALVMPALESPKIFGGGKFAAVLTEFGQGAKYFSKSLTEQPDYPLYDRYLINQRGPEKSLTLKETAIESGTALATSFASAIPLGVLMKGVENVATFAGDKLLLKLATTETGNVAAKTALNVAGVAVKTTGQVGSKFVTGYFVASTVVQGSDIGENLLRRDYSKVAIESAGVVGGFGGFTVGAKGGDIGTNLALKATGQYVPSELELPTIKKTPSNIQADILLQKDLELYAYRRGSINTGNLLNPRLDKYLSQEIENPTKQVFFRYAETKGVGGEQIDFVPSIPTFVQPPTYFQMLRENVGKYKGEGVKGHIKGFAETPIVSDALIVKRINTGFEGDEALREKVVGELAIKGKLPKTVQQEVLQQNTLLSDKLREKSLAEEQELVFREQTNVGRKPQIFFTRNQKGKLIPVVAERGVLSNLDNIRTNLLKEKIITEQDAAYIQRNLEMNEKFMDKLIQPKGHTVYDHGTRVRENINKLIDLYPEFKDYFTKKYGSLDIAKEELGKGGLYHDIGKTSESSKEFGRQHGKKAAKVMSAGLFKYDVDSNVIKAIETHETINPTRLSYKVKNVLGSVSPEQKILATADRLELARYGININPKLLPLPDALTRLGLDKDVVNVKVKKGIVIITTLTPKESYSKIKFGESIMKNVGKYVKTLKPETPYLIGQEKIYQNLNKGIKYPTKNYKQSGITYTAYKEPSYKISSYKQQQYKIDYGINGKYEPSIYRNKIEYTLSRYRQPKQTYQGDQTYKLIIPEERKKVRPPISLNLGSSKKTPKIKQSQAYAVFIKRRGKFEPFATGLSRGEALKMGSDKALTNLARTFKIAPTGKTKEMFGFDETQFMPKESQFRGYKIVRGKKVPLQDIFIQKTAANLQSREEKFQIADAKRMKKLIGY